MTTAHFFDVAVRDVEMATAAYTLARLTEAHEGSLIAAEPAPPLAARAAQAERRAARASGPFSFRLQARPIEVSGDP